jgi:hypothetical protein
MNRPFNIFPSIGYKNSQFQIISSVDNLKIDIYNHDNFIRSIEVNSDNITLLKSLNTTGKIIAKCNFNSIDFHQELEIKEAIKLGSSEFKRAFVFDNTNYSFFLMKDRLLLYNEKKKILLTENHYSPTDIYKIDEINFVFVTRVGNIDSGIINLGIYNTENYAIVGELLNDYREIKISPENNKAWLYNIKSKTIHCFELTHHTNKYLTELKSFEKFNDYFLDDGDRHIYINHDETLQVINLNNLHNSLEISKTENNAIDKHCNVYSFENNTLNCQNPHTGYSETTRLTFNINLTGDNFIHIGNNLAQLEELSDLNQIIDNIKEEVVQSLPDSYNYYFQSLTELEKISEVLTTHTFYPTRNGIFIIENTFKRTFYGVTHKKYDTNWHSKPNTFEKTEISVLYFHSEKSKVLIDKSPSLSVHSHLNDILVVSNQGNKMLFFEGEEFALNSDDSIELFTINEIGYFLIQSKKQQSLFRSTNPNSAVLDQVEILNLDLFKKHQIIWYSVKDKDLSNNKYLNAFDLKNNTRLIIDEQKLQLSYYRDASNFKFCANYAKSSNQIVFNPETLEIKDSFIGNIESLSKNLDKVVSYRNSIIYLSVFNPEIRKYELSEISIENKKYKESYLAPDGQFLMLQDESNTYSFYDIKKGESINFFSGNFLAFRKDGSFIIEEDNTRAVKIIDPETFEEITPPNYHHYRFMSPDGKLYAQVSSKGRHIHILKGIEINANQVTKIREELDEPSISLNEKEREKAKIKVAQNRKEIFNLFNNQFKELGILDYNKITSQSVVKMERYTEIGITGTDKVTEVQFPIDLAFYNYSAFSYDNKYFGYVGKPSRRGLINLFKIEFDEANAKLVISDTYLSRYPDYASWVCGFSKTGYFATYDSTPDTYIIKVEDSLFKNKTDEIELRRNIYKSKTNIYNHYNNWNKINGKNFLCFSPTGNFLALSEQGYEPLTQGGYGHQESNVVHIAETASGKILDSFTGHGEKIKDNRIKKVTYVAFSENENKIMTLSSDGVVILRDLNIIGMI